MYYHGLDTVSKTATTNAVAKKC